MDATEVKKGASHVVKTVTLSSQPNMTDISNLFSDSASICQRQIDVLSLKGLLIYVLYCGVIYESRCNLSTYIGHLEANTTQSS